MKLPSYEQRGAQAHPTQSLESATAVSRAMNQTVQTAAEVGTDIYKSVSVADYNRGMAERSKASEELQRQYEENEYMLASELGDLANETNTELRPMPYTDDITGETGTRPTPVVPTSEVMSAHYAREMGNIDKAVGESLRTDASRFQYEQQVALKVGPEGQASVDGFAFERNREIEASRTFDRVQAEIDAGNDDGAIEAIQLGVTAGHIARKDEAKLIEEARTEIFVRDVDSALTDPDMDVGDREALGEDIANAPGIDDKVKQKALAAWQKQVFVDHKDLVADATIDRDYGRLHSLLTEYTEEDYQGALEDTQRLALIGSIERTMKAWQAATATEDKYLQQSAKMEIEALKRSARDPAAATPAGLAVADIGGFIDEAYPEGAKTAADAKQIHELRQLQDDAPYIDELDGLSIADTDNYIALLRQQATTPEQRNQVDRLEAYQRKADTNKENDPQGAAVRAGIIPPESFDPMDIKGSLLAEIDRQGIAVNYFDVPNAPIISQRAAQGLSDRFTAAGATERVQIYGEVYEAVGGDRAKAHEVLVLSAPNESAEIAALATAGANNDVDALHLHSSGKELLASKEGREWLDTMWPARQTQLADVAQNLYDNSEIAVAKVEAVRNIAAGFVANGHSSNEAIDRATRSVMGGAVVRNTASGEVTIAHELDATEGQFRRAQQRIPDADYERFGYTGAEPLRELVVSGDAVFKRTDTGPGKYHVRRTDLPGSPWVRAGDGNLLVVDMADVRGDAGVDSWFDRAKRWGKGQVDDAAELLSEPTVVTGSGE